ncbi:MAG: tetratricopeptide repeat protein, partial [Persicimonas sp.]
MGAAPAVVVAQESDDQLSAKERARRVEELATQGARAYRSGDFDEAITSFERAYQVEPVPNLLYNIAKSYERQEDFEKAVEYYQRFIVAPEVDSEARQAALDRIDRLREITDLKQEDIDRAERKARNSEADGSAASEEPDTPDEPAPSNSTALWTMGGGGAVLAGGVVVGLMASSSADEVKTADTYEERTAARDSAKTQA